MSIDNLIRFTIIVLLLIAFVYSGFTRRKADQSGGDRITFDHEPRPIYFMRVSGALLGYGGLLIHLINPRWMAWATFPTLTWLRLTGLGLAASMVPMLIWMLRSLGNNITPTVVTRQEHQLVTSGPYRYIRHPLYTFGGLMFVGVSLALANWWTLLWLIIAMVALFQRTDIEEERLIAQFGNAYREYMLTTGRYLPKF
jgi:protein-S-isoprenylcysteine O-methyltransferase Ste14